MEGPEQALVQSQLYLAFDALTYTQGEIEYLHFITLHWSRLPVGQGKAYVGPTYRGCKCYLPSECHQSQTIRNRSVDLVISPRAPLGK